MTPQEQEIFDEVVRTAYKKFGRYTKVGIDNADEYALAEITNRERYIFNTAFEAGKATLSKSVASETLTGEQFVKALSKVDLHRKSYMNGRKETATEIFRELEALRVDYGIDTEYLIGRKFEIKSPEYIAFKAKYLGVEK